MVNVNDVAKWFLSRESITHKKLQKLCYYAQAWHLALLDEPLFNEEIQAWIHGPVCPALYRVYSGYRWLEIPKVEETVKFNERTEELLEAVYSTYGGLTGNQLERLTHSEKPWQEARGTLQPFEPCEKVISFKTMKKYYAEKYEEYQAD